MPYKKPPLKRANRAVRTREWLSSDEVDRIIAEARKRKLGKRDALMIEVAWKHALRPAELVELEWKDVIFSHAANIPPVLNIYRQKTRTYTSHKLQHKLQRKLNDWKLEQRNNPMFGGPTCYVFSSRERMPMSVRQYQTILQECAKAAGLEFPVHPYMLRHTKAVELVNQNVNPFRIQHFMGHKSIQSTQKYIHMTFEAIADLSK